LPAALSLGGSAAARIGLEGGAAIADSAKVFGQFTQAGLLGRAGEGAAAMAKGWGLGQVGQAAIRGAFETALMQGGEEMTKKILDDPGQSAENAISHVALAGLFGGA